MEDFNKTQVGMVQINNSFDRQNYLPLSLGFLQSYAQKHAANFNDFSFSTPIYKRISVDNAIDKLKDKDIVNFSTYVWNFELSSEIARRLKKENPETTIVFGGCHVPESDKNLEIFLRNNSFIDIASIGEGERSFVSILENYPTRNWENALSLGFIDNGEYILTPKASRIEELNQIPSPYLNGFFDSLMEENPDEEWIGLFETNRGCPFSCTFCDWGINSKKRMTEYDLEERIFKEVDWFSENEIKFVYCCDANFGIYGSKGHDFRDLKIAEYFAKNKKRYGFPQRLSVQNTKNSTDASYNIQRVLVENDLDQGVLLAFQSLHGPTLDAIKRRNIKLETFFELQRRFTNDGVTTFSDLILGLPLETYETFTQGVSTLMEKGQHNRIQFNNLSILPNAPMRDDIERYGLEIIESDMVNTHGSLGEWVDDIYEKQQLVVSTDTMPTEDWIKTRNFCYMTSLLHFDKLLQIPNIIMNQHYGIKYDDIIDRFVHASSDRPIISEISSFFSNQARDIQRGKSEYCHSKKWLDIWWPADELAFIDLMAEDKVDEFYEEAKLILSDILKENDHVDYDSILSETLNLNRHLIRIPFQNTDLKIDMSYNIPEVYKGGLVSRKVPLIKEKSTYVIDRTTEKHDSWEDWTRRVVWWKNKTGDYMYPMKKI